MFAVAGRWTSCSPTNGAERLPFARNGRSTSCRVAGRERRAASWQNGKTTPCRPDRNLPRLRAIRTPICSRRPIVLHPQHKRRAMAAFPEIQKIRYEGPQVEEPAGVPPLQRERAGRRQDDEGPSPLQRGLLAHAARHRAAIRSARARCCGPGKRAKDSVENAINRVRVAFEFIEKLGAPFYCFHDRDVAPEGATLAETNKNLDAVVKVLKEEQQRTGIKLLWGTANLFSNPRYMHGAATSPNADAFAFAAAQVKKALEVTKELGGAGLRVLGRPRRLPEPLEHRHEARGRPPGPLHAHGRRLRQADRLQRASSTSSPSPRSRPSTSTISTRPPASTSSAPTAWPTTSR